MTSSVQWVDPGYLIYAQVTSLVARAFDPDLEERFTGEPIPIAEPVERSGSTFKAAFSASRNGTFVYQPSSDTDHLAWIDRSGAEVGTISAPGLYQTLQLSPDGSRLVTDRVDSAHRRARPVGDGFRSVAPKIA